MNSFKHMYNFLLPVIIAFTIQLETYAADQTQWNLSFKNGELTVVAQFAQAPQSGVKTQMLLTAYDNATQTVKGWADQVKVVLWMTSMGHGSAPTQVEPARDELGQVIPGVLNVKNVYFVMPGDWQVRVILTNEKGLSETQSFDLML